MDVAMVMVSVGEQGASMTQCCSECHLPLENDILDIRVAHYLAQLVIASVYK